jgi:hypothetical protein
MLGSLLTFSTKLNCQLELLPTRASRTDNSFWIGDANCQIVPSELLDLKASFKSLEDAF